MQRLPKTVIWSAALSLLALYLSRFTGYDAWLAKAF
jgi:hypothetical protein